MPSLLMLVVVVVAASAVVEVEAVAVDHAGAELVGVCVVLHMVCVADVEEA